MVAIRKHSSPLLQVMPTQHSIGITISRHAAKQKKTRSYLCTAIQTASHKTRHFEDDAICIKIRSEAGSFNNYQGK